MRFCLVVACAIAACAEGAPPPPAHTRPVVQATMYPVAYFAERIGAGVIDVRLPLPADADPAFWRPDEATLGSYQRGDLVVSNGAEFERWMATMSLPERRVVRAADAFRPEWILFPRAFSHRHGKAGAHTHTGVDGHTWLDPQNAKREAIAILEALVRLLPDRAAGMRERSASLGRDLDGLDAEFRALKAPPLLSSHPAYHYVARRYGWAVESLALDPSEMPGDKEMDALLAAAARLGARWILWESEPLPAVRAALEAKGGPASLVFSPVETRPASGDYLTEMRANLARLRSAWMASGER